MTNADIRVGDARTVLETLPAGSVHCCVTSPPYFGLRDYGVAGQLGLEPTLEAYIETMVGVFREVRRVLRDDGTLLLNIGSSYASSGGERSYGSSDGFTGRGGGARRFRHVPSCGTDDRAPQDFLSPGSAYSGLCDGCLADFRSHRESTESSDQRPRQVAPPVYTKARGSERPDSSPATLDGAAPSVPESTSLESWLRLRGECSRCDKRASFLYGHRSSSGGAPPSGHTSDCRRGTSQIDHPSDDRTQDTELSCRAWVHYISRSLKPKDLIDVPAILALALQADGWWLRSEIVWAKKAPMPESVMDRPTSSHEKIFLLTKAERYYYDAEAVREKSISTAPAGNGYKRPERLKWDGRGNDEKWQPTSGRNLRNVWHLGPEPFPEAHFATFPTEIPRRAILAGTSERGVCSECGAPWVRETERGELEGEAVVQCGSRPHADAVGVSASSLLRTNGRTFRRTSTRGWSASCECGAEATPATVLDPFNGAGTTGVVAGKLGRDYVGIELNEQYAEMSERRILREVGPLLVATGIHGLAGRPQ